MYDLLRNQLKTSISPVQFLSVLRKFLASGKTGEKLHYPLYVTQYNVIKSTDTHVSVTSWHRNIDSLSQFNKMANRISFLLEFYFHGNFNFWSIRNKQVLRNVITTVYGFVTPIHSGFARWAAYELTNTLCVPVRCDFSWDSGWRRGFCISRFETVNRIRLFVVLQRFFPCPPETVTDRGRYKLESDCMWLSAPRLKRCARQIKRDRITAVRNNLYFGKHPGV